MKQNLQSLVTLFCRTNILIILLFTICFSYGQERPSSFTELSNKQLQFLKTVVTIKAEHETKIFNIFYKRCKFFYGLSTPASKERIEIYRQEIKNELLQFVAQSELNNKTLLVIEDLIQY